MRFLLPPDSYYLAQDCQRAGLKMVYYCGLDPYYLKMRPKPVPLQLELMFLLLMYDLILISPSTLFGPFWERTHLRTFLTPFWVDNSLTTSIGKEYQNHLEDFIAAQLSSDKHPKAKQQKMLAYFQPQGYSKTLLVRDIEQQSGKYKQLFYTMYRRLFTQGRHRQTVSDWCDPQAALRFEKQLRQQLELQHRQQPLALDRKLLMQSVTDPRLIEDSPAFLVQGVKQLALSCYFIMGAQANACELYPYILANEHHYLTAEMRHNNPLMLQHLETWLHQTGWNTQRFMTIPAHILQRLRHQQDKLLKQFRQRFHEWVNQGADPQWLKPIPPSPHSSQFAELLHLLEHFQSETASIAPKTAWKLIPEEFCLQGNNSSIKLSPGQYRLLDYLDQQQTLVSSQQIAQALYQTPEWVRSQVSLLRKHLSRYPQAPQFLNKPGTWGYQFSLTSLPGRRAHTDVYDLPGKPAFV